MSCASAYKWVTNVLQIWFDIHGFCWFSLIFISFHLYLLALRDIDALWIGLQMGYRFAVESIGFVGFH